MVPLPDSNLVPYVDYAVSADSDILKAVKSVYCYVQSNILENSILYLLQLYNPGKLVCLIDPLMGSHLLSLSGFFFPFIATSLHPS